jgi:hypothetical protein
LSLLAIDPAPLLRIADHFGTLSRRASAPQGFHFIADLDASFHLTSLPPGPIFGITRPKKIRKTEDSLRREGHQTVSPPEL